MKIARIVLTATVLLSLKSTLFCSSENPPQEPTLQRTQSFDALRDRNGWSKAIATSWVGYTPQNLIDYTLEHCGHEYQGKIIRPGSNEESIRLWNEYMTNSDRALKFLTATAPVESDISELPYYKKAGNLAINGLNNEAKVILAQFYHKNQNPSEEDRIQLSALLTEKYNVIKNIELRTGVECQDRFVHDSKNLKLKNILYLANKYKDAK